MKGLGKYKPRSAQWIDEAFLCSGDVVIDVGAADGEDAVRWADRVGPTGAVIAIEPHPDAVARVRTACVDRLWVTCLQVALGAEPGVAHLYSSGARPRASSVIAANVSHDAQHPIQMTTLDTVIACVPRPPRLVKVDAQGAEAAILRGAVHALTLPIVWVLELWSDGLEGAGASVAEVLSHFRGRYTPRTMKGVAIGWDDVEQIATRRPGPRCMDVLLVPAA